MDCCRMKKIQAKKKKDRAEAEYQESAPEDGKAPKSLLDNDDDLPVLFT